MAPAAETEPPPGVAGPAGYEQTPDGRYYVFRRVALLDEHRLPEENGQPAVEIGPRELEEIAAHGNERVAGTGDATPVVVGHTRDGQPELKGPPIIGYAKDFVVGRLGTTDRLAVFANLFIRADRLQQALDYPRRSVELWVNRLQIDPICCLGATSPERDLGLLDETVLRYQRPETDDDRKLRFAAPTSPKPENATEGGMPDAMVDKPVPKSAPEPDGDEGLGGAGKRVGDMSIDELAAALMATKPFAQLAEVAQLLSEEESANPGQEPGMDGAAGPEGAMPGAAGAMPPGPPPAGGPPGMGAPPGLEAEARGMHEPPPLRYSPSAASATNPYMPGAAAVSGSHAATHYGRSDDEMVRRYARELAERDQKQAATDKRVQELEAKVGLGERMLRFSKRRQEMTKVRDENLLLLPDDEMDRELEDTADFADEKFAGHLQKMVKHYRRQEPVLAPFRPATNGAGGLLPPLDQRSVDKIASFASRHSITDFREAAAKYASQNGG